MDIYSDGKLHLKLPQKKEYPFWGIIMATILIGFSPFVSEFLSYFATLICLYRIIKFDAKVFAADYCVLVPFASIFRAPGGVSFLIYICLIASIWYFFKGKVKVNISIVLLFILFIYLFLRMEMDINKFVLCFGQMFVMYVLLLKQDTKSAEYISKAFCISLVASSIYAFILRNTPQIIEARGKESVAIWGTSFMRFQGLLADPNYFMTFIIVGIAILAKLRECEKITSKNFWVMGAIMATFGLFSYSKTFFIVFGIFIVIYIIWQFKSRKYKRGLILIGLALITLLFVLFSGLDLFTIIISRLISGTGLSDFTTGRSDIYLLYIEAIVKNPINLLFGYGFAENNLGIDAHNIYLEIIYYLGLIGFIIIGWFYSSILKSANSKIRVAVKQHMIQKYVVIFIVALLFLTLHGLFEIIVYCEFFLAALSIMLVEDKQSENQLKN